MKTINRIQVLLLALLLSIPSLSFAERKGSAPATKNPLIIDNPLKNDSLIAFINSIIDAALKLGAIVSVVAVILAGFMFVTAHGDEDKIKTAKNILLYAVIGMVILLGARMISEVIINTVTSVDKASK